MAESIEGRKITELLVTPYLWRTKNYLEPQTTIYKWLFQLDDEPNLYIKSGCFTKHPFLTGCLGFQVGH